MADYTPRLKASYNEVVRPAMKEEFILLIADWKPHLYPLPE